ncbi:hypothetical protein [Rhizobium ruizarguesonis]|uniref:hypothetical protein n=1 Tax=Rhizobium ruizarguesonis TaxID=2081791 RepID=UPI001031DE4E|nr:hypothetical protein [Rhizobium ruizarguesonis]TBD36639.1 hypothetical protein ELH18_03680 [Rhizobium ruizarguesonis]TBD41405.1 hypothetical protein ELH19_03695 [Rhizobium ruizarguesonis]TBD57751.1 hypothetical protein ELH15_03680 [Rhizobium ruizarguesonis]TBD84017.1 hypothetical protein ELH13_03685 [Rhizobium ruizarguesonis]TBD88840.1 hypothetical protein ELH14_03680 [Rhizobium ruizarguesonis]
MTLAAGTYFEHLKAYVNGKYVMHDGTGGKVVLTEKYFRPQDVKPQERKVNLVLPGAGMAFKLDHDDFETSEKKSKPALFHFLDDTAKPWSKRCDFVIFYVYGKAFHADCIEFKSKSLTAEKIVPQLKAGVCWVSSLKRTIEHYTGDTRRIRLRKFVFAENDNPGAYLDANRQLVADPSVRYYHFDEVQGQSLATLHNTSVQEI